MKKATAILDPSAYPYPDVEAVYEMTEQQYLDWDHEGGLADWIEGRTYHYMSAAKVHQPSWFAAPAVTANVSAAVAINSSSW